MFRQTELAGIHAEPCSCRPFDQISTKGSANALLLSWQKGRIGVRIFLLRVFLAQSHVCLAPSIQQGRFSVRILPRHGFGLPLGCLQE